MYDEAQEIFDYIPLRLSKPESEYTQHLLGAFDHLSSAPPEDIRAFAIMPFHLLFMLALQYKVMRMYTRRNGAYTGHKIIVDLNARRVAARTPTSVYDLALISESYLAELLEIMVVDPAVIAGTKMLVRLRNDGFAHAKGAIERDIGGRIEEYLSVLRQIPQAYTAMNDEIAQEWLAELAPDDDRQSFIETRLASEYLCLTDFHSGLLRTEFAPTLGIEPPA